MTNNTDNLYNYPTKEEYLTKIHETQENELKSERFATISKFLDDNYYNRENIKLEKKLFNIIGSYGIEDNLVNKSNSVKIISRFKRYKQLQEFLSSLDLKTIDSNIFLKRALQIMVCSYSDCVHIYNEFLTQMSKTTISDNETRRFEITCNIPKTLQIYLPLSVNESVGIPYYRPQDYKISYIDILDKEHKYVYEDYNRYVNKIKKIAEDIYLLQLNLFTNHFPGELFNSHFMFYMPGRYQEMIATYYVKPNEIIKDNGIQQFLKEFENSWNNGTLNVEPNYDEDKTEKILKKK